MAQRTTKELVSDRGYGFILPEGEPANGRICSFTGSMWRAQAMTHCGREPE